MAIARDIFGYRYEDSEPAFVDAGSTFWFHRPTNRLLTKVSVAAYMASFTPAMTMAAKEAGTPSAAFLAEHTGIPIPAAPGGGGGQPPAYQAPTITPVTGLPITGDPGGTQTVDLDVDFHATNIPVGGKTATITYNIGAADVPLNVNLTAGMTPSQAMNAIDAAIDAVAKLSTSKAGTTITVTPADTVVLSKLTLTIA